MKTRLRSSLHIGKQSSSVLQGFPAILTSLVSQCYTETSSALLICLSGRQHSSDASSKRFASIVNGREHGGKVKADWVHDDLAEASPEGSQDAALLLTGDCLKILNL